MIVISDFADRLAAILLSKRKISASLEIQLGYLGRPGLDFWCSQTMRSRIEPTKKIARTLRKHRALILNHFKARKEFPAALLSA